MLTIQDLSKTYADGTRALSGLTLSLAPGEIVAVVGGSGCGKTTLLRLVAGLDVATAGSIRLDGVTIDGPHPGLGLVFQEPRLLPWLSIAENVGFGLADRPAAERRARVARALDRVGLAEHAGRWPRELSGGQQQRVAIARAFVADPRVLLLDEPFSALDAVTREDLHRHLLALWAETRPTILLVTHDVAEAASLADRVVVMRPHPGRIHETVALDAPRSGDAAAQDLTARTLRALLDQSLAAPPRPVAQTA
ncbi:ABC transporter ATP-binding protein [Methylobacterium sp. Leaf117]|jgi:sulfonate transport system ATP-binding protein|uniref:ABC transporter ATP-binding protein n=1 Tax=Methylobacterium sp. Leaf117 TaxID=1736260 RepID=UPI0006F5688C|nr:ABC transporter ATP-binding protein [Methylobacterium sp. Leaf117]KQP77529.1 nitrate/sulfonate/bicarbonate ABC transporter ATP-binding protein [Methylobacterium sp. Leaf117]